MCDCVSNLRRYITVDSAAQRKLFYILIEAEVNADAAPLVLWLAGGPGCSGVSDMLTGSGPFIPIPGTDSLAENEARWSKEAHMVYIESPAFVGFSTSADESDVVTGDRKTAQVHTQAVGLFDYAAVTVKRFRNASAAHTHCLSCINACRAG